jgi:hypothetical protein
MKLAPFLLDEWLDQKNLPGSQIEFDLGVLRSTLGVKVPLHRPKPVATGLL